MLLNHMYLLGNMINGCLHDELQQYIYSAGEDLTLEQINQEFAHLYREYGLISEDNPRTEMYGWADVVHTFQTPFYYISYAVSAAGAYSFWLESPLTGDDSEILLWFTLLLLSSSVIIYMRKNRE